MGVADLAVDPVGHSPQRSVELIQQARVWPFHDRLGNLG
jgi:hypothetical protein